MRFSLGKMVALGILAGTITVGASVSVSAAELDTEIPGAGISIALNGYIEGADNPEAEIASLLPEKVEKAAPARNAIFDNMAIAFVDNYVNVRKKPTTESKIVGKIYNNCAATIIEETNGWYKIESGNVVGYIKGEFFLTGSDAEDYAIENGYVLATVKEAGLRVRARATTNARIVSNVYENSVYAVRNMTDDGSWTKLAIQDETGANYRGWVSSEYIELKVSMDSAMTLKEEREMIKAQKAREKAEADSRAAEEEASRQAAQAAYEAAQAAQQQQQQQPAQTEPQYQEPEPTTAAPSYNSGSGLASDVVAYAKQFLGTPYVWGGSSLTSGTDCSGFTMSVYAHFGYGLNRASYQQVYNGTAVSLDAIQPGDLLFYTNGGSSIEHVALYIGGGQIIHASTPSTGVIISSAYGNGLCAARRIIN